VWVVVDGGLERPIGGSISPNAFPWIYFSSCRVVSGLVCFHDSLSLSRSHAQFSLPRNSVLFSYLHFTSSFDLLTAYLVA
jgi:hypothetical protein